GGGIGYISFNHDLNMALTIRSLVMKDGTAYLQAGAGIVADSVPENEYNETLHKARSLIEANKYVEKSERGTAMKGYMEKKLNRESLTIEEMKAAATSCFADTTSESELAAFLTALRAKGETPEEIAGLVEVIRAESSQTSNVLTNVMDNCGTGGDGSYSFNISTTAAFVIAGAGVTVAKHGNRS